MGKIYNDAIIADTSGLVSLFVPIDRNHAVAVDEAKRLQNTHKNIIIINAVEGGPNPGHSPPQDTGFEPRYSERPRRC
jgi:hypothetical protein